MLKLLYLLAFPGVKFVSKIVKCLTLCNCATRRRPWCRLFFSLRSLSIPAVMCLLLLILSQWTEAYTWKGLQCTMYNVDSTVYNVQSMSSCIIMLLILSHPISHLFGLFWVICSIWVLSSVTLRCLGQVWFQQLNKEVSIRRKWIVWLINKATFDRHCLNILCVSSYKSLEHFGAGRSLR